MAKSLLAAVKPRSRLEARRALLYGRGPTKLFEAVWIKEDARLRGFALRSRCARLRAGLLRVRFAPPQSGFRILSAVADMPFMACRLIEIAFGSLELFEIV